MNRSTKMTLIFELMMLVMALGLLLLNPKVSYFDEKPWSESTLQILALVGMIAFLTGLRRFYIKVGEGGKTAQLSLLGYNGTFILILLYLIFDPTMFCSVRFLVEDNSSSRTLSELFLCQDVQYTIFVFVSLPFACWLSSKLWLLELHMASLGSLAFWVIQTWLALANSAISGYANYGMGLFSGWIS